MTQRIPVRPALYAGMLLLFPLLLSGGSPTSQDATPPTVADKLSVQATSVVVDVIVTDHKGRPVNNLTANDFKVYEDGAEQKVTTFVPPANTSAPAETMQQAAAAAPGVTASQPSAAAAPEQRQQFLTVVLDLTDNRMTNIQTACETVIRYLKKNKTTDTAVAIYYVAHGMRLALPFTPNMDKAEATLQALSHRAPAGAMAGGDRASIQQQVNELYVQAHPESQYGAAGVEVAAADNSATGPRAGPMDPFAAMYQREYDTLLTYMHMQNSYHARDIFVALRALALSYRDMPGRKNVVLFSEGFTWDRDNRADMESVIEAANMANVSFYVFDPSGLGTGDTLGRAPNTKVAQMNSIASERAGQRGGESKFDRMEALLTQDDNHEQLGQLATSTGGVIVFNTNDLGPAFSRVLDETRNFYTLVYHPANKSWDGTFRKLKVTLNGQQAYLVRHRLGYWAIPRTEGFAMTPTEAHLFSSAQQGLINSTVKPTFQANEALAPDAHWYAPFSVTVPVKAVLPPKGSTQKQSDMVMVAFAYDAKGKLLSTYERHVDVTRGPGDNADQGNVTFHGQLALPGPQPVRVQTILQLPEGKFSLAEQQTDVARSSADAPILSSLIVTDQIDQANCEDLAEALCLKNIRLRQRVPLEFASTGKVLAYVTGAKFTVDPATKNPRVGAKFVIRSGDKVVATIPDNNVQAMPGPAPQSVVFIAEVPLNSLPKGNYTMEATGFDLVNRSSSKQTKDFRVQ